MAASKCKSHRRIDWALSDMAQVNNVLESGLELVAAQVMYAIVGAIAMERGGEEANKFVKARILNPLGLDAFS